MSKTASGLGKLNYANVLYNPPGDLKSGIPAATLIPAPVRNTIFLNLLSLKPFTKSSYLYCVSEKSSFANCYIILSNSSYKG